MYFEGVTFKTILGPVKILGIFGVLLEWGLEPSVELIVVFIQLYQLYFCCASVQCH